MKRIAFFVLLALPQLAWSQTEVSGSQSGVWGSAGSPYLVTGNVTIPSGLVLTIEPGVEVNFQGHYKLTVNGNLQAIGAAGDSIHFTTDNPTTGWGGIRVDSSQMSNLSFCRIEYGKTAGDYPDIHGGGLALLYADALVSNCTFADNDATGDDNGMGGAVYAAGTGSPSGPLTRFSDCTFVRNHAYGEGGAIKFTGDMNTEMVGCVFIANDCGYGGGAVSCYGVTGTKMINCLFADNYTMYSSGGAINTLGFTNTIYLINCTLSGNTAVTGDGGAVNLAYATGYFLNSIVYENHGMYSDDIFLDWGGEAEIYYCDLTMPSGATGSNNIDENPRFADASNLDFELLEDSPCIDAGTAYFALGGEVLIDLSPDQYHGSAPDMGAFEYNPVSAAPEGPLAACKLDGNYPNPFSQGTTIHYRLSRDCPVTVDVFDVMGRKVRTLVKTSQVAGPQSVSWNGRNEAGENVSPGTYVLRLRAGDDANSMRMLLLR